MPKIESIKAYNVDLPLKDPFETAKGRKTVSPAVIVELGLSNGQVGLGAATPVKYVTGEDVESVLVAIESCRPVVQDADVSRYRPLWAAFGEMLANHASARAAMETAVLDGFCKTYGMPMSYFFGGSLLQVETDLTIPIVEPSTARELAEDAAAKGFNYLKIKVGGANMEEDLARVIAVSEGAPDASIMLDANQGFAPEAAVSFVSGLVRAGVKVDLLEQPVDRDDVEGLEYVTRNTSVPVLADEAVVCPADAIRLIRIDAIDGVNIKLMKAGISGALDIISICRAAGKRLMLGSMIETGIGAATSVSLAAGTGAFAWLDLDSHLLATEEPFPGGYTFEGPFLRPNSDAPGHGARPKG